MNNYIKIFDELPRRNSVKFTFAGRDDTFLIYTFFKNDKLINLMASKIGLCDFWMKKSIVSHENYHDDVFKDIYVFGAIDIEGNNAKFC